MSGALDVLPNKTIVEALVTAIDAGDEAAVRTIVDEGLVSHGALGDVHGPDGYIGIMLRNVRQGFPDAHVEHWQGPDTSPRSSTWAGSHRPSTDELGPLIPVLVSP